MKLIKLQTLEYPVTSQELKNRFPSVMFPEVYDPLDFGYAEVIETPQPTVDQLKQKVAEGLPVYSNSAWNQTWTVVDLSDAEKTQALTLLKNYLQSAMQDLLDSTAASRGYDSSLSLTTYVDDPNPTFAVEATTFKSWRSAVWTKCYAVLAAVIAGTHATPTKESLLAELPTIVWPN